MPDVQYLGLVVEGSAERDFWLQQRPWFQDIGYMVRVRDGKDKNRLVRQAQNHYEVLKLQGCTRIVFLFDQDADGCPPEAAARLAHMRAYPDVLLSVSARELEALLLADSEALLSVTRRTIPHPHTDDILDPKGVLRNLYHSEHHQWLSDTELLRRFASQFSLQRAALKNSSAARFLTRLTTS